MACPVCGAPLPPGVREEFCPACLLGDMADAATAVGGRVLGDCELFEEIGRGGMGVVWRGRQRGLHRDVAVKTLPGGAFASEEARARFRREAQAAARLRHPGIVAIYGVGEDAGMPYFIMELVEGRTMAVAMAEKPVPVRQAVEWLREVSLAIAHAHSQGVLHRDIKPSNILIEPSGRARVADFGLAKLGDEAGGATLTFSGTVAGSPAYMPPEQAHGRGVTERSDIYSLGAVLYHLLAGCPPFQGDSIATVLAMVAQEDPISPRRLNASTPRDLDTICLKCLEKAPARRYSSAIELADDLSRFLDGHPVLARPVGRLETMLRLARRRPMHAASLVLGAALLATLLVGLLWQRHQDKAHLAALHLEQSATRSALATARLGEVRSLISLRLPDSRSRASEILRGIFADTTLPADILAEARDARLATLALDSAHLAPFGGDAARMEDYTFMVLTPDHTCWAQAGFHGGITLRSVAGGDLLMAFHTDEKTITALLGFSAGNRYLAVRHGAEYGLWDCSPQMAAGASRLVFCTTLWPRGTAWGGGHTAITPDESAIVWALPDGRLQWAALPGGEPQDFSPVGKAGSEETALPGGRGGLAFSADGRHLLAAQSHEPTARLYSWPSGALERVFSAPGQSGFSAAALNADASLAATGSHTFAVVVWHTAADGAPPRLGTGHGSYVKSLAFSPDGSWLGSTSEDATVRLWQAHSAAPVLSFPGECMAMVFSPDGQFAGPLLQRGLAGRLRMEPSPLLRRIFPPGGGGSGVAIALDGTSRRLAISCSDGVAIANIATCEILQTLAAAGTKSALWSNDDTVLLTCGPAGIQRWAVPQGESAAVQPRGEVIFETGRYPWSGLSGSADGRRAASVDRGTQAVIFRTAGEAAPIFFPTKDPGDAALSPDAQQLLVSTSYTGGATVHSAATGQVAHQLALSARHNVCWSEDGRWAAGSGSSHVIWNTATWQPLPLPVLESNAYPNGGCAFTVPGPGSIGLPALAALVEGNSRIALLYLPDCRLLARLEAPGSPAIAELTISRDGHWLISACATGDCHRWDLRAILALLTESSP